MPFKKGMSLIQTGLVHEEDQRALRALSVSTLEELMSLLIAFPMETREFLKYTDVSKMLEVAPRMFRYSVSEQDAKAARQRVRSTGARPPEQLKAEAKATLHLEDLDLKPGPPSAELKVYLSACLGPIRDQGNRGTCVAHAVVAMQECLEYRQRDIHNDLSEQFLYWLCKLNDFSPNNSGTWQRVAVPLVVEHGICLENLWPYNPNTVAGNEGQGPPPLGWDVVFNDAGNHKPTRGLVLDPTSTDDVMERLDHGYPVAISVPVYLNWWIYSVEQEGHIPMPLPGTVPEGGHAMCIVGYGYDMDFLGGGYFIVRNSWGTDWAPQSPFGAGYGTLPFSYIRRYGWEAFSLLTP